MRLRKLSVLVVVALAVAGLSACTSKVGAAAIVGSHRIGESELGKYVRSDAKPYLTQDQSGASSTVIPKSFALETLIDTQLFEQALEHNGGPATAAEITTGTASALSGATLAQAQAYFAKNGYQSRFTATYIRDQALIVVLGKRVKSDTNGTQVLAALNKLHTSVQVNPRYGSWNKTQYALTDTGRAGLPSFLQIGAKPANVVAPAATG